MIPVDPTVPDEPGHIALLAGMGIVAVGGPFLATWFLVTAVAWIVARLNQQKGRG